MWIPSSVDILFHLASFKMYFTYQRILSTLISQLKRHTEPILTITKENHASQSEMYSLSRVRCWHPTPLWWVRLGVIGRHSKFYIVWHQIWKCRYWDETFVGWLSLRNRLLAFILNLLKIWKSLCNWLISNWLKITQNKMKEILKNQTDNCHRGNGKKVKNLLSKYTRSRLFYRQIITYSSI